LEGLLEKEKEMMMKMTPGSIWEVLQGGGMPKEGMEQMPGQVAPGAGGAAAVAGPVAQTQQEVNVPVQDAETKKSGGGGWFGLGGR
jgi:hypothetical protein